MFREPREPGNMMKRFFLLSVTALFVYLAPASAMAASGYAMVVTGEAEIGDDDLEKAREATRAAAAREVILAAIETDVGRAVVEQNSQIIQNRLLVNFDDYLRRSRLVEEKRAGKALFGTWDIEVDLGRVRTGLQSAGVSRQAQVPRLALLWALERRREAGEAASTFAGYVGTSWSAAATEPAAITQLQQRLTDNGLNVVPPGPELNRWMAEQLAGREVDKAFLRNFVKEAGVDEVLFVRMVGRPLDVPPAARLQPRRVNHIAFLFDGTTGELRGAPLTATAVHVEGADSRLTAEVPHEWIDRLVQALIAAGTNARTRLTVVGLSSVGQFDAFWQQLKSAPGLNEAVPTLLSAQQAEFDLPGTRSPAEWQALLAKALPEASVTTGGGEVRVELRR